jgi:hypothetical protein
MSKLHMTDVVVSQLQESGTYWDETTPGFGIRVGKNRKTWVIMRGPTARTGARFSGPLQPQPRQSIDQCS